MTVAGSNRHKRRNARSHQAELLPKGLQRIKARSYRKLEINEAGHAHGKLPETLAGSKSPPQKPRQAGLMRLRKKTPHIRTVILLPRELFCPYHLLRYLWEEEGTVFSSSNEHLTPTGPKDMVSKILFDSQAWVIVVGACLFVCECTQRLYVAEWDTVKQK